MNRTKSILTALAAAVFMMSAALVAQGQNSRTWVSGLGSDGNSGTGCQQAAPCRTFATAIGVTNPAGQVVAVDNLSVGRLAVTGRQRFFPVIFPYYAKPERRAD